MRKFLAKSNPEETLIDHTNNLIENFKLLKSIYPDLEIDWDMLYKVCLYHDLGKINEKFQRKLVTGRRDVEEIPHGILSLAFIDYRDLKRKGYSKDDITILFHAIGYHHDRDLDFSNIDIDKEIDLMRETFKEFAYNALESKFIDDHIEDKFFTINDRIYEKNGEGNFFKYIMIKGLLNRIDYAASAHIDVENKNDFLLNSLEKLINNWKIDKPESDWNELQKYMLANQDNNIIVIAQTGMGKTEAGLLWIGDNKGFFTLPLKTAINAIYKRIIRDIVDENIQDRVGLLHSDTRSEYISLENEEVDFDEYYNKTRQLSLPLTICTIDQIFDFVYRYRGFESKLATLAYSKVVIDEIQMYSPQLLSYLIIGIRYITRLGGKFTILTATLPRIIVDILREEKIDFVMPDKPFIDNKVNRHSLKVIEDGINADYILNIYNRNKVLVICNTVKKAQEIYRKLEDRGVKKLDLLHSRFIKKDRKEKEERIMEIGRLKTEDDGIWVCTQVVEASLDIDFDLLITELSDLNGLFQRMGRCYRKRELIDSQYNCHLFIGGNGNNCSGIGNVIYKEIFDMSREAIKGKDGILTEEDKVNLVDSVYTMEKLKGTEYHKKLMGNIEYVKSIDDHEKTKAEIQERFRDIDSKIVIPEPVYKKNEKEILECISIISKKYDKNMTELERRVLKKEKIIERDKLMDYTVSVRTNDIKGNIIKNLELNKYESIPVIDCEYSQELGVKILKREEEKIAQDDRFM